MHFFEIAALAAWIINLALAFFILLQDVRSPLYRAYFVWGLGVALWNLGAFFLYQPIPREVAIWWARLLQLGLILVPLGLYETVRLLADRAARRRWTLAFLALHTACALSLGTTWFIRDLQTVAFGRWPLPGPLAWVVTASSLFLTGLAAFYLAQEVQAGSALHRTRMRAVLGALTLLGLAALHDLLPTFGFTRYPLLDRPFYPFGSMAACVYMVVVGYSVLQHRLLDAQLALSRAAAHLVRFGFLALSSLALLVAFNAVVPGQFNDISFAAAILVQVLGAVVASVFFPRLFGQGLETVERRILGDQPEYTEEVRAFVQRLNAQTDLLTLSDELHQVLIETFSVKSYGWHLRAVAGRFHLQRGFPEGSGESASEITGHSPLARYFDETGETFLAHSVPRRANRDELEEAANAQLQTAHAELAFALCAQEEPIGFLLLGPKESGDPFTATDLLLLTSLVNTLGLVINQIRLKMQISQAQEFELLGRMSSGLAHDLNNLLTPISTLLQLGAHHGELNPELLPVATRNVAAIRDYIREGLFFSQHQRPDFQYRCLDAIVERAREVCGNSRASTVAIEIQKQGEVWAEVDAVMIERLLSNLMANAIDASLEGQRVVVAIEQRAPTAEGREWLRLRVIDQGSGIAPEDLPRVFTPYFTTKNRGDRRRGFGIGLAICRKIAALHGGELSLESEISRGTTVAFDLPKRQEVSLAGGRL